jgi:hypothetical protein
LAVVVLNPLWFVAVAWSTGWLVVVSVLYLCD